MTDYASIADIVAAKLAPIEQRLNDMAESRAVHAQLIDKLDKRISTLEGQIKSEPWADLKKKLAGK